MGASKVQRSHRPQESGRFRFWCRHVDISSLTLSLGERRRFVRFIFGHDTTRESLARRSSLPSYRISLFIPSDSQVPKQQFPMPRYRAKLRPSAFLPASLVPFLSRPAMRPCPPPVIVPIYKLTAVSFSLFYLLPLTAIRLHSCLSPVGFSDANLGWRA